MPPVDSDPPDHSPADASSGRAALIESLSERQISYLRLVQQNHTSKDIARLADTTHRAVDKQLGKVNEKLGTTSRVEAVRLLAEYERGVESSYPPSGAINLPSPPRVFPLPSVLPSARASANMLTWKQAAIWTGIISIGTPIALAVAGMAFVTLELLLGMKTP